LSAAQLQDHDQDDQTEVSKTATGANRSQEKIEPLRARRFLH
jgi:hypothetical protein